MQTGKIKWFDAKKGFGFIVRDDAPDVFVHGSAVRYGTKLNQGDLVEFEIENSQRGERAARVRLIQPAAQQTSPTIK
jgi:CspA family cold shock protein